MPQVIWLPEALEDTARLRLFLKDKSPTAAARASQILLNLKPLAARLASATDVIRRLRPRLAAVPGIALSGDFNHHSGFTTGNPAGRHTKILGSCEFMASDMAQNIFSCTKRYLPQIENHFSGLQQCLTNAEKSILRTEKYFSDLPKDFLMMEKRFLHSL